MRIYFVLTEISAIFVFRKEKKDFMKNLAMAVWCAIILSFTGWMGWTIAGIGFLFYAGCWLYVTIREEIKIRKWMKGED